MKRSGGRYWQTLPGDRPDFAENSSPKPHAAPAPQPGPRRYRKVTPDRTADHPAGPIGPATRQHHRVTSRSRKDREAPAPPMAGASHRRGRRFPPWSRVSPVQRNLGFRDRGRSGGSSFPAQPNGGFSRHWNVGAVSLRGLGLPKVIGLEPRSHPPLQLSASQGCGPLVSVITNHQYSLMFMASRLKVLATGIHNAGLETRAGQREYLREEKVQGGYKPSTSAMVYSPGSRF